MFCCIGFLFFEKELKSWRIKLEKICKDTGEQKNTIKIYLKLKTVLNNKNTKRKIYKKFFCRQVYSAFS